MIRLPCEICEKRANSLRYRFGKLLRPRCYDSERSKPDSMLVSNKTE